jgi:hypothetical protein
MKPSSQPLKEEKNASSLAWPLTTAMKHRPPALAGTWKNSSSAAGYEDEESSPGGSSMN